MNDEKLDALELLCAWLKNPVVHINQHDETYIHDLEDENAHLAEELDKLKRKFRQLECSYSMVVTENIRCYDTLRAHGLSVN